MAGSVFEQYQRYFESLITQHKASCKLENQHSQPQEMPQQPPQPPVYQPFQPIFQPNPPMYFPAYSAPAGFGYYGRVPGVMPYQQCVQQQPYQQRMQHWPDNGVAQPLITALAPDLALNPDGRAKAAPEADKKPATLCYPFGVSGYQGGISCSPCTSCKSVQPHPATQKPQHEQQQQQPCDGKDGKDCNSGWAETDAGGESASKGDRLPLGVQEPFIVGPTTYQYFYDRPA